MQVYSVQFTDGDKESTNWISRSGVAKVEYENGDVYEGSYNTNGERHGNGVYTYVLPVRYIHIRIHLHLHLHLRLHIEPSRILEISYELSLYLSLYLCIYIHIIIYLCMCMCMCI